MQALSKLDLTGIQPHQQALVLDRSLIFVRLLLAGFDRESFTLTGAERVVVEMVPEPNLSDLGIEQTAHRALFREFAVSPEDLKVRLLNPFIGPWLSAEPEDLKIEVVPPSTLPAGKTTLHVRLFDGERLIASRPAQFEVTRRQKVVVAAASLDRRTQLEEKHLREEVRFVDREQDRLTIEQLVGRRVQYRIGPGEVLSLRHLVDERREENPTLVKARDNVRLVVRKGGLTVTVPGAEALQAGGEGDLIRVRNMQSNRIVTGRVVARGEVEVSIH
jgi:flagellar basal body P-ring formation protein FlgA